MEKSYFVWEIWVEDYWFCCKNLRLKQGIFSLPNRCFLHNVFTLKLSSASPMSLGSGTTTIIIIIFHLHSFTSPRFCCIGLCKLLYAHASLLPMRVYLRMLRIKEPKEVNTPPYHKPKCQRSWFLMLHHDHNICWETRAYLFLLSLPSSSPMQPCFVPYICAAHSWKGQTKLQIKYWIKCFNQ